MDRVIVVGAGLVGTYLAVLLAERGHAVEVYDRGPDPRLADGGSGRSFNITLAHRGLAALDRVGVGERARLLAIPALGRWMHAESGEVAFQPYGTRGEAIHSISRHHLHCALVDFAERRGDVAFRFGHKCLGVDLGRPAVRLRDRATGALRTVAGDRLLGCDGAFSAVRRRLQRLPRFDYAQQFLDQGYKELTAPAERCRDLDRNAIHIWPRGGYMLIGFANLDGSFTLALHLPFEGEPSCASLAGEAELGDFFARRFPDAVPLVPRLAAD
jgi:kynurenine 3-monooxygenase